MSIHAYSVAYTPPMPVCTLYLGAGGEEPQMGPLEAVIDTGADITIILGAPQHTNLVLCQP